MSEHEQPKVWRLCADVWERFGWRSRFFRFLVVGALNTAFGQGIFIALVLLGVSDQLALLIATIVGVLFNFRTIGSIVFESSERKLLLRFVLCYVISYGVNAILLKAMIQGGLSPIPAQIILALPVAVLTFVLNRKFVFASRTAAVAGPEL